MLAERSGDRVARALLEGRYSQVLLNMGRPREGAVHAARAEEIARSCDDPALRAAVGSFRVMSYTMDGDRRAIVDAAERVLAEVGADDSLGRGIVGYSPRISALQLRAVGLTQLGRLVEGAAALREATHAAEAAGDVEVLSWNGQAWAWLGMVRGDREPVPATVRRSLELAERLDNEASRMIAHSGLGIAHLTAGDAAAAREALRKSASIARERGIVLDTLPSVLGQLAEAELALGERAAALAAAREATAFSSDGGYAAAEAHLALARVLLADGDPVSAGEAEAALRRAEDAIERCGCRVFSPRVVELRGRLAAARGDAAASRRLLRDALALDREIGATGHAARLARELEAGGGIERR
jgi:tetratricopeptide (TPR) repeat protein